MSRPTPEPFGISTNAINPSCNRRNGCVLFNPCRHVHAEPAHLEDAVVVERIAARRDVRGVSNGMFQFLTAACMPAARSALMPVSVAFGAPAFTLSVELASLRVKVVGPAVDRPHLRAWVELFEILPSLFACAGSSARIVSATLAVGYVYRRCAGSASVRIGSSGRFCVITSRVTLSPEGAPQTMHRSALLYFRWRLIATHSS